MESVFCLYCFSEAGRAVSLTSKVAIVKGKRGHEPVFKVLDLVDYETALSGWDTVLAKVNFTTVKTIDRTRLGDVGSFVLKQYGKP
jgi:hypothetical protein